MSLTHFSPLVPVKNKHGSYSQYFDRKIMLSQVAIPNSKVIAHKQCHSSTRFTFHHCLASKQFIQFGWSFNSTRAETPLGFNKISQSRWASPRNCHRWCCIIGPMLPELLNYSVKADISHRSYRVALNFVSEEWKGSFWNCFACFHPILFWNFDVMSFAKVLSSFLKQNLNCFQGLPW